MEPLYNGQLWGLMFWPLYRGAWPLLRGCFIHAQTVHLGHGCLAVILEQLAFIGRWFLTEVPLYYTCAMQEWTERKISKLM